MTKEKKAKIHWSKTSLMHAWKLVFRSALFLVALGLYIYDKIGGNFDFLSNQMLTTIAFIIIFTIYLVEMILRFIPNSIESMGCQKIFKKNYQEVSTDSVDYIEPRRLGVFLVLASWIVLNLTFGILYWTHIFDEGILVLISLLYGICDMICILFFCPFQTWMMKNKCCNTCRIYNWDFAMMFTPLLFIPHWLTLSLAGVSILLLINWEIIYFKHKERFYEVSNASLQCANCKEKLCTHKKQLQSLLTQLRSEVNKRSQSEISRLQSFKSKLLKKKNKD